MQAHHELPSKTIIPISHPLWRYAVLLPCALFVVLALPNIERPGLHYDEALEAGLPAVHLLHDQPIVPLNGAALTLFGHSLPLMVQDHIGAAQVYLALPFIALFGATAFALRLMTIITGLLALVAVYIFLQVLYSRRAALYGSLWLACCASLVFWMRQGVFVTSLALCLSMWMLAAGAYWWRTRRLWALGAAGVCGGLSVYCKLNATWLLFGLAAWLALIVGVGYIRDRRATHFSPVEKNRGGTPLPPNTLKIALVGVGGLLIGLSPLILYNIVTRGATLRVIRASATDPTFEGARNTNIVENFGTRVGQIVDVIRSGNHLWYLGGSAPNDVAPVSIAVAALVLVGVCVAGRGRGWQILLLPLFLLAASVIQSCYTISALWPTHFAVSIGLPAIIFGIAADRLHPYFARWRWGAAAIIGAVLLVVATQLVSSVAYANAVATTGGRSQHTAAIYDLNRFVQQHPAHYVVLDWGISTQLEYLQNGNVSIEQQYNTSPGTTAFRDGLRKKLDPHAIYITHAANQEVFAGRAPFLDAVKLAGDYAQRIATFDAGDGSAVFEAWHIQTP